VLVTRFETSWQLTKRLKIILEHVGKGDIPSAIQAKQVENSTKDVKVGDIVLRKNQMAAGQTYKYALVVRVHEEEDGKARSSDEEYKIPGEK
jgi:hypothetical protein